MPCAAVTPGRPSLAAPPISPYVTPDRPYCPLAAPIMHCTDSVSFLTRHTALCPPMPCAEVILGRLRLAVPPISPYVNPDRPFCPLAALAMHCSDPGSPLSRRTHWGTYVLARVDGENKLLMEVRVSHIGFCFFCFVCWQGSGLQPDVLTLLTMNVLPCYPPFTFPHRAWVPAQTATAPSSTSWTTIRAKLTSHALPSYTTHGLTQGMGASPDGNRPFLDLMDLDSKETRRLWQSNPPYYENLGSIMSDDDPDKPITLAGLQVRGLVWRGGGVAVERVGMDLEGLQVRGMGWRDGKGWREAGQLQAGPLFSSCAAHGASCSVCSTTAPDTNSFKVAAIHPWHRHVQ